MTTARPGAASRISPGRVTGRLFRSCPDTVIWLAMLGATRGPPATLGAPVTKDDAGATGALAAAVGTNFGLAAGCFLACGAVTLIVGSAVTFDGVADGRGVTAADPAPAGAAVGSAVCAHALKHSDDSRKLAAAPKRNDIILTAPPGYSLPHLAADLRSACVASMMLSIKVHTARLDNTRIGDTSGNTPCGTSPRTQCPAHPRKDDRFADRQYTPTDSARA